jgi:hypothetical protein
MIPGRSGHGVSAPVQLAAVHLPPSLDRRQMVRMATANSVQISETDRWSAALDEMVRNVLARDLVARLPHDKLILPEAPAPAGTPSIVVTLTQFGPDANGTVTLNGSWSLLSGANQTPTLSREVHLTAGVAPDADASAAAMSQALGQLADRIAQSL